MATAAAATLPTGTINITGTILDKGCTLKTQNLTINLTATQISDYSAVGATGPMSEVAPLELTDCPANISIAMTVAGTVASTADFFAVDKRYR